MLRKKIYPHFISFIICVFSGNNYADAQVIENPVFDRTDTPAFRVCKVELNKDTTYIYCSYSAEAGAWANISKETYLRDVNTNETYPLLKSEGLPYAPERRIFDYKEVGNVKLSFKAIQDISKFDLIENPKHKAFNVFGIDLNNQYKETFDEIYLNRLITMSSFYESAGDSIKSIQYKKKLVEAQSCNYGRLSDITFFSLLGLCVLYDKFGFHQKVIEQIQTLSKLYKESWGDYSLEDVLLRRMFSENYIFASYYDVVIETIRKSIDIYEKNKIIDNVYAFLLRNNADSYNFLNDEVNFVQEQKKCIEIRKKVRDERYYLEDLLILLIRNTNLNIYEERLSLVEAEVKQIPSFVNTQSLDYVFFLKTLALQNETIGRNEKANIICDQMIKILEKDESHNYIRIAEIMGKKCRNLKKLGLIQDAINIGTKAIELYDSLNIQPKIYRDVLGDLALIYNDLFDYEKAISLYKKIAELSEKEEDWLALTESLLMIGNYYKNKTDLDEAEKYIKNALDVISHHDKVEEYLIKQYEMIPESIGNPYNDIKYYNDLILSMKAFLFGSWGFVASEKGNLDEAIKYELKAGEYMKLQIEQNAEERLRNIVDNQGYALHLISLSNYYSKNGQYDKSNDCAKESMEYFNKGKESIYRSYELLSLNHYLTNDIDSAMYYANLAYTVSDNFERKNNCLALLAFLYFYKNDYNKAEECMSSALDYLRQAIKKDIVGMSNEQKQRLWRVNEFMFLNYRKYIAKCEWNMVFYSKLLNYTLFSKGLLLDTDNLDAEQSIKRMDIIWKDIQKKLSNQDIAIEFITTQDDSIHKVYHALVIDSMCEYPNMITLFSESDFELLKLNNTQSELEILGNLLWKPILSQYSQVKNIFFSPDGLLYVKPIEHCQVDGVGEIADHYNIFRLSSTKEIIFQEKKVKRNNATLYGGLDYDLLAKESKDIADKEKHDIFRSIDARGGFDPLISTLEEVNEISKLLNEVNIPAKLLIGAEGTEDSFMNLSGKNINMLHLSTHGMYVGPDNLEQKKIENGFNFLELITNDKDPVKEDIVLTHSFLVMSGGNKLSRRKTFSTPSGDGILTAFEISNLDLSKVDLVVLSACETGLGDIENGGVYGLQRGFKKAGVNTILMSLNKVDDEATKILMVEFYKNLVNGKTKHQSLKNAQKYLRQVDDGKYNKPEYWASFIMLDGLN